jgi:cytochrome c-type biogenesis protein CcmF
LTVALGLFIWKIDEFLPLLGFTLLAFVVSTIVYDTALALRARRRIAGEGILHGLTTLTRRNQRRYGGLIVHLGVVLIMLGIAGSMTYSREREATLASGQSLSVGDYRVQFEGLRGTQQPTHLRVEGSFRVFHREQDEGMLQPALKFFPTQQAPIGRATHLSNLREDIYLILSGFSEVNRNEATVKVLVRPLVVWMWIGGFIIAIGTLICILPIGKPAGQEA